MNNYQILNKIGGVKTKLTNLQKQSNILKRNFFDYIEGLNSEYNVLSNFNPDDFSFEIFGNKLKLKANYNSLNDKYQGKLSVQIQTISNGITSNEELLYINFDTIGNVKLNENNYNFYTDDFAESFYIEIMNKLTDSNKFEL